MESLPISKLVKKQTVVKRFDGFRLDGGQGSMKVVIRYDDECGNGHNSFSITGTTYRDNKEWGCGCIHDDIAKFAPELAHLIKWHLTSSDGPMYYIANTMYHARDTDTKDKKAGDPIAFDTVLKFNGMPFTFKEFERGFFDYLKSNRNNFNKIEVVEVPYDGKDSYDFAPNYSLTGFDIKNASGEWYKAPFKTRGKAIEFLTALQNNKFRMVKHATKWCQSVKPDIEAARRCAVWEDATIEQLQSKEALKARLPALMHEFKAVIESLGMEY